MKFEKATRTKLKARMGIVSPSGGGKTWTALVWAMVLGKRIAVIDSENKSARKYVGLRDSRLDAPFAFDDINLTDFSPRVYIEAIKTAERESYDVIVIDGISQAWAGKGGVLEIVDSAAAKSRGNKFAAWREGTPEQNAFVDAMVQCKAHLIVTMRAKTEYVLEDDERGKKVPRKIGMAPIQREGLDYEFDFVGDMDWNHRFVVTKTRCSSLDGKVWTKPGPEVAREFLAWLDAGVEVEKTEEEKTEEKPAPKSNGAFPADPEAALLHVSDRVNSLKHSVAIDKWLEKHFKKDIEPRGPVFVSLVKDVVTSARAAIAAKLDVSDFIKSDPAAGG